MARCVSFWHAYTHYHYKAFLTGTDSRIICIQRPAIFDKIHHLSQTKKAITFKFQKIVDHIKLILNGYDIEDDDRGLPAYMYNSSMLILKQRSLTGVLSCRM